jgi:hypothetical protein
MLTTSFLVVRRCLGRSLYIIIHGLFIAISMFFRFSCSPPPVRTRGDRAVVSALRSLLTYVAKPVCCVLAGEALEYHSVFLKTSIHLLSLTFGSIVYIRVANPTQILPRIRR